MTPVRLELRPASDEMTLSSKDELSVGLLRLQCHSCRTKPYDLPRVLGHSRFENQFGRLFKKGQAHDRRRHKETGDVVVQVYVGKKG